MNRMMVMVLACALPGCQPGWNGWQMGPETPVSLSVLRGRAPDDLWGGGFGGLWHWNGRTWTQHGSIQVADLCLVGGTEVWVAGADGSTDGNDLFRWDGERLLPVPRPPRPRSAVSRVWGLRPDDVYIERTDFDSSTARTTVLRWNGTAWWELDEPFMPSWGVAAHDLWSVSGGALLHWDGDRWTPWISSGVRSVWGTSADRAWAVGDREQLWAWNGSAWSLLSRGTDCGSPTGCAVFNDVWASGPNDVWMVGASGPGWGGPAFAAIHHWDGRSPSVSLTWAADPRTSNQHNEFGLLRHVVGSQRGPVVTTDGRRLLVREGASD